MIPYKIKHFRPQSPYSNPLKNYIKRLDRRVAETMEKGLVNVIFVSGRSQTGKSTWADYKAKQYDENYNLIYEVEDFFKLLDKYKQLLGVGSDGVMKKPENLSLILWKWNFWDEPQLTVQKQKFWDERVSAINNITSSWGFLKQNLILATPDTSQLPNMLMRNITCKVEIRVFLKNHKVIRRYYVYIPMKNNRTQKWFWGSAVESDIVPELQLTDHYFKKKQNNFFNVSLNKWKSELDIEQQKKNWWIRKDDKPLPINTVMSLLKEKRIDRDRAYEEVLKNGYDYERADLLLDSASKN